MMTPEEVSSFLRKSHQTQREFRPELEVLWLEIFNWCESAQNCISKTVAKINTPSMNFHAASRIFEHILERIRRAVEYQICSLKTCAKAVNEIFESMPHMDKVPPRFHPALKVLSDELLQDQFLIESLSLIISMHEPAHILHKEIARQTAGVPIHENPFLKFSSRL